MAPLDKHSSLKHLPGVDHLLDLAKKDDRFTDIPRSVIIDVIRKSLDHIRQDILADIETSTDHDKILFGALILAKEKIKAKLVPVVNATGVVLHTNLGRSLLCNEALINIKNIAQSYSNLELKIETGKRGIRYEAVDELICELTGAQGAIVVNNNAGAVLLTLNTIAKDTDVVVSRGELVEIGGSFRVPDVMTKSGCILKEVGTTNRTHLRDYADAVSNTTGLFLKVHTSNYKIEGFTASVALKDLVLLGKDKDIPVMDFSKYGLPLEPTIADSVRSGADVITFSGDKLLGGPQAGIIIGQKKTIDLIKENPLTRALRIDKLTLAALESTLKLYRDEKTAIHKIPTLRMLTIPFNDICKKADILFKSIKGAIGSMADIEVAHLNSRPGGGSFPELKLATKCITIKPINISVSRLETLMRLSIPSIIGRIEDNKYILDTRTIQDGQDKIISSTLTKILVKK